MLSAPAFPSNRSLLFNHSFLSNDQLNILAADIKRKKELANLSDTFIIEQIIKYFQRNPKSAVLLREKFNPKSAVYKETIKRIREQLRRSYGLFRPQKTHLDTFNHLFTSTTKERSILIREILKSHSSTKERFSFYPAIYSQIFKITGKPTSILDLACGLNPLSLPLMKLKAVKYYAYDINCAEIDLLNLFFTRYHQNHKLIQGRAAILDLHQISSITNLPRVDIAFLWKIIDILDANCGHTKSEAVIKAIPATWIIVSFATKTMSGKPMTAPKRRWMEWMCNRLGYEYIILEYENEIFYVIKK